MNLSLWIQYVIVIAIVLACIVKIVRQFRKSAGGNTCAGGCSACSSCGTTAKKTPR